jgi:hypothetical protein
VCIGLSVSKSACLITGSWPESFAFQPDVRQAQYPLSGGDTLIDPLVERRDEPGVALGAEVQPIGRDLGRQPSIRFEQLSAETGVPDPGAAAAGADQLVDHRDLMPLQDPRHVLARPQAEQQNVSSWEMLTQFQQVGSNTFSGDLR